MQSQGGFPSVGLQERTKEFLESKWEGLNPKQKAYAKKAWGVITYKWRWQIALNIPYLLIFILDRSVPAVHKFDMAILSSITSRLPIPNFLASWWGLG